MHQPLFPEKPLPRSSSIDSHAAGADGKVDVFGEHERASSCWHLYKCSVRQVVVNIRSSLNDLFFQLLHFLSRRFQLLLQTIYALDLVVALRLGITPGLSIELCLCLDSALVVTQRQQRSGADGGSVGILQRQKRERAAWWML
jgi:hypothetical protein